MDNSVYSELDTNMPWHLYTNGGIEVGGPYSKSEALSILNSGQAARYGATHIRKIDNPHGIRKCGNCPHNEPAHNSNVKAAGKCYYGDCTGFKPKQSLSPNRHFGVFGA